MPGIYFYTGNRLEILADKLAEIFASEPLPPLEKEIILIQSRGMARWLALETAGRLNIWANCECPFPNTFIRNIFKLFMPHDSYSSPFDKDFIVWHLMNILPELISEPHFRKIRYYIESGEKLKLYQFANEVADLFDQYTLFRPDMVLDWEAGKNTPQDEQVWQSLLWSHLVERLHNSKNIFETHRARHLKYFEEKLLSSELDKRQLPTRVSLFGISSLPPYHLRVLANLARHIDLHLFIMNPCKEFWFDIIADRDIVKISRKAASTQDMLHLEQGNDLLSSMGHLGRDFLSMVQELDCAEQELFQDPGAENLLAHIQQDILYLRSNTQFSHQSSVVKKKIRKKDTSITFQSCHSPMREVEVLHDQLLGFFEEYAQDDPIDPRDILIMAPDINEYAPFIRAVFDAGNLTSRKLPYSISDQSIKESSRYIDSFFEILSLCTSRFSSIDVLGVLKTEPVKKRFNINDQELFILERWIYENGICWGIDQEHKNKIKLPDYFENTWRAGLDRLLLGYATIGDKKLLFKNTLPYNKMEGNDTKLLGNFLDYTESLFSIGDTLIQKHTLAGWSDILIDIKNKFLLSDDTSEADDRLLNQSLHHLKELQVQTSFDTLLSIDVIQSYLINNLEQRYAAVAGGAGFLTGGITFCSMLPMRAIPFKIICLLGMNDGLYPRAGRKRSFDLMALDPQRGDRSRRYDDRYLFLETILSTRKKLYISFTGQSINDGSTKPPSVLVNELMDYIEQGYLVENNDSLTGDIIHHLTTSHRLQPFHHDYFCQQNNIYRDQLFSYSSENCAAAVSFASKRHKDYPVIATPLSIPSETYRQVEINDLIKFFSHPSRYILTKRVGIAFIEESHNLNINEPFSIKGLEKYTLENNILEELLEDKNCEELYRIYKAKGLLPHGKIGEIEFIKTISAVQSFRRTLDKLFLQKKTEHREINLEVGGFKLAGRLDNLTEDGLVQYRYATIKPKDLLRCWINHLVLNTINKKERPDSGTSSLLIGKDKTYNLLPVSESRVHLDVLLTLYWNGLSEPLHFFPRTSFVYARETHKGKSEQEALLKAKSEWEGNTYNKISEKNDPYNSLCFKNMDLEDTLFKEQAKMIFLPILEHQARYSI